VMLYELLTGRLPFSGNGHAELLRAVLEDAPAAITQEAPAALVAVSLKCLEKEPARRYATAAELADDLERFLHGEPVLARPLGGLGRAADWAWRRARWLTLGAAALALAAIVGWALPRPQQPIEETGPPPGERLPGPDVKPKTEKKPKPVPKPQSLDEY